MQLKVNAARLVQALDITSIPDERQLTPQKGSSAVRFCGFHDGAGRARCRIYARSDTDVACSGFALDDLQGQGAFTFPRAPLDVVRTFPGTHTVTMTAVDTANDGTGFRATLESSGGVRYEQSTYDPHLITPCDKDFEIARATGVAPILITPPCEFGASALVA